MTTTTHTLTSPSSDNYVAGITPVADPGTEEWLPINLLVAFPGVSQRTFREPRAKELASTFDPLMLGVVHVNLRPNGVYSIIDGQHRVGAMRLLGWHDRKVRCQLYRGLPVEKEAAMFIGLNNSTDVTALETFPVALTSGEAATVAINNILEKYGWRVGSSNRNGNFSAVRAARSVYEGRRARAKGTAFKAHVDGPSALDATFATLTAAWGHDTNAAGAMIVQGLGLFFMRYSFNVDRVALERRLAAYAGGPAGLLGAARALSQYRSVTVPQAVAEVVTDLYNKGRRSGMLPDWRS